jgi:hypothetical protein
MRAGGVATGNGVGDEGYSTFVYAPGLGKGVVFAQYHAVAVASGEDQNALLGYDFAQNRWDILEVTEAAWSEFLPGVGHDQGNATVDPVHDLYITRGNMTLHGNTAFQTYVFDLKAGRGRRMMSAGEPSIKEEVAMAFSPDHGVAVLTGGPSWLYDLRPNVWRRVPGGPSVRAAPSLVYDGRYRVFVMFGGLSGGLFSDETWILDPATGAWSRRTPAVSPPGRKGGSIAYDADNGVTLLVGGVGKGYVALSDVWTYDTGSNTWTRLPVDAPKGARGHAGNNLIYDTRHKVFLLKSAVDLRSVWAFRHVPAQASSSPGRDAADPSRRMRVTDG